MCQYIVPRWPLSQNQNLRSTSVQVGNTWSLKRSITRQSKQKFVPSLIITGAKNFHSFVCKQTGFVHQRLRDFVKRTLNRVIDCGLSRVIDSSHIITVVTYASPLQESPLRMSPKPIKYSTTPDLSCWSIFCGERERAVKLEGSHHSCIES